MESAERQHLDSFLLLQSTASKLRQKLSELLLMVETQRDTVDWPKYLSTFGLCASELVEIRKFLESERFASAQSMILTPRNLSTDGDSNPSKSGEDHLLMFNHDTAPQYLRTKLDPQVEALRAAVDERAASLRNVPQVPPKHVLALHDKIVVTLLDDLRLLKQEMDQDQEKLTTAKSTANQDDLFALVATMTVGREYAMRIKSDGPK